MLEYRDAIGQPGPYLVVPAMSDGTENGRRAQAAAAQPTTVDAEQSPSPAEPGEDAQPNGRDQPPGKADAGVRARQTAEELFGPDNGHPPQPAPPLQYGDGSPLDENNSVEVQAFRRFLAEKQAPPASRAALQAYYLRHAAVH